jgi:MbtH protein
MAYEEADDTRLYRVVLNDEEQYSIWPVTRELPAGWREEGTTGSKRECLDHIDVVWTDMRPLSLRRAMEAEQPSS